MQQINDTEILIEQPHMLAPKQLELKDKLLKQIEHTIRLRLTAGLRKAFKCSISIITSDSF